MKGIARTKRYAYVPQEHLGRYGQPHLSWLADQARGLQISETRRPTLAYAAHGLLPAAIAKHLHLSEFTIRGQLRDIFRDVGAVSIAHLARIAIEGGLTQPYCPNAVLPEAGAIDAGHLSGFDCRTRGLRDDEIIAELGEATDIWTMRNRIAYMSRQLTPNKSRFVSRGVSALNACYLLGLMTVGEPSLAALRSGLKPQPAAAISVTDFSGR